MMIGGGGGGGGGKRLRMARSGFQITAASGPLLTILISSVVPPFAMPTYDDHRAWITVDDEIIPEFDVKITEPPKHSEDPVTITCWVPSELGKVRLSSTFH